MNWSLAKIRLSGIGPIDARFDPLEIDLTDPEVSRTLDTVLWLTNGGGKTVLIRLLFSVLRPDRVAQIGIEDQRPDGRVGRGHRINHLGGYVLPTDTAHVILEWRLTNGDQIASPVRLVTGLVAAWRAGRATGELSNLRRAWYTVRSEDGAIGADDIVTTTDDRRIPISAFRESIERLGRTDPQRGRRPLVRAFDTQTDWLRHLDDVGLDPAIFDYELTMNRGESSANNLLSFTSDREFIGFLLRTIIDADSIAGVDSSLAAVASKIARVPETERELSFVTGVASRLDPLSAASADIAAAQVTRSAADRSAEALRAALAAAEREAQAAIEAARRRDTAESARVEEAARRKGAIDAEVRELRLAAAQLGETEARIRKDATETERDQRQADVESWGLVERLVRQGALDAEIEELSTEIASRTRAEAPLRARRDAAAEAIRSRLLAESAIQRAVMGEATAEVDVHRSIAETLVGQARDARDEALQARGRLKDIEREAASAAARRDAAVRNGVLVARERAGDALERTRTELDRGIARLAEISDRRLAIAAEIDAHVLAEGSATKTAAVLRSERDRDAERLATADAERADHAGEALIRELAESDAPDLDAVGPVLVERLADRAATSAKRRLEIAVRSADDRRALDALERTKALPPTLDVEAALTVLNAASIPAVSGWAYLAETVRPDLHQAAIQATPDLAAGVVVTRPSDLPGARAALDDAGLETTSVLTVAVGAPMVAEAGSPPADRFVVPPPTALHDRGAVPDELERRTTRVRQWDDRANDEAQAESTAQRLSVTLSKHLEAWPPGSLLEGQQRLAEQSERLVAAETEIAGSAAARVELRREDTELGQELARLNIDGRKLSARVPELERLVADEALAATRPERLAVLETEVRDWLALETSHTAEATNERVLADTARDRSNEARNAIVRLSDEVGRIVLGAPVHEPDLDAARSLVGSGQAIDGLRARFKALDDELAEKTVGSPAAQRLAGAQEERGGILAELGTARAGLVDRARELLGSDEGRVDAERRRRAAEAAETASRAALKADVRAEGEVEEAEAAVREALRAIEAARYGRRPEIVAPADRLAAEMSIATLTTERSKVDEAESAAVAARDEARHISSVEGIRVDHLSGQRSVIESHLGPDLPPPARADPFTGDREAIADAVRGAGRALAEADHARRTGEDRWRAAAERLTAFLREERNEALAASPLGRKVAALATSPVDVTGMANEVRLRAERLRTELEELKTHRELLVHELAEATDRALREIAQAERRSRLPDGLYDWSREPFLQIKFERPASHDDLRARLTGFVADVVGRPAESRPAGAELLLQACEAAIVGEFRVSLLKPNDAYALRYVPVQNTAVMSNGQRATAAMCLLMILTELRAKNRTKGVPGVGVLFLDNPFGNASAGYLVAVQRRVAEALGIQPVYTTGVRDYDAFAPFRNKVALSNDQARGRMLRYVRANPALLTALEPRDPASGHVASARVIAAVET